MFRIDPRFRHMGKGARRRRLRIGLIRGAAFAALPVLLLGAIGYFLAPDLIARWQEGRGVVEGDLDLMLSPVDEGFEIAPVVRGDTFTDIPGDPMIIRTGRNDADGLDPVGMTLAGPDGLDPMRAGPPAPDRLTMVRESLYQRERRLVATLPTTHEEFALFQAARSRERWADAVQAGGAAPAGADAADGGQGGSGLVFTRESDRRPALWQDLILQARLPADPAALLQDNGFDRVEAERVAERVAARLGALPEAGGELPAGSVLALRYRMQDGRRQVLQLSLYRAGEYVGSLALSGSGRLAPAADPWIGQDLLEQSAGGVAGEAPQFRLLDVIYSAALRQGVPASAIGEAIALMSQVHDLDGFASEGDRLELLYATRPGAGAGETGRVLFVGIDGPAGRRSCYVVPQPADRDGGGHACHSPDARLVASAGRPAMSAPVAGVLSRRFAPPASGESEGGSVTWQAAQGSPVVAVAAGRVTAIARESRGATVTISHADGLVGIYRGLDRLPAEITRGAPVHRDMTIGRVAPGTAGLEFRLLRDDRPVDPLPYLTAGHEILGSTAVEALISRIIHVESAGNAAARNPLSTATGLGQFIESTWLRMLRSYRPDLIAGLDRQAALDLRLDAELSRQMVRHLAQENESHLRARGHAVTPGNLYLAHFLGPEGAARMLAADGRLPVAEVAGQAVVSANPFLRSYSVADLRLWAARKMDAPAVATLALVPDPPAIRATPEVERFVALVDGIRASR